MIRYYDGAGNGYYLSQDRLVYDPLTPIQSSSGTYSGGEPAEIHFNTALQYQDLEASFQKAIQCTQEHTEQRTKGTSHIYLEAEDKSFYIAYGSSLISELEKALHKALGSVPNKGHVSQPVFPFPALLTEEPES